MKQTSKDSKLEFGPLGGLDGLSTKLIDQALRSFALVAGPFLLAVALLDAFGRGALWIGWIHGSLYLMVFVTHLGRRQISSKVKVYVIFWAIFLGSFLSLVAFGLVSAGSILLLCLVSISSAALGRSFGHRVLALAMAAHVVAYAIRLTLAMPGSEVLNYFETPIAWGAATAGFAALWLALNLASDHLTQGLQILRDRNAFFERREGMREEVSEALADSEARYRRLTDYLPDLVWRTDLDGAVLYVNPAVESLFGIARSKALGLSIERYLSDRSAKIVRGWMKGLVGNPTLPPTYRGELEYLHHKGQLLICEVNASAIFDVNHKVAGFEGVTRDISRQRKLEEDLAQSQRLESIGHLAGGIAHDFNNILAVILGRSALLIEDTQTDSPLLPDLRAIQASAERAKGVTEQLLTFSRRQMQKLEIVELDDLLRDAHGLISPLLGEQVLLELSFHAKGVRVELDRGQFTQVVLNLAINARDAMPSGGKLILRTARHSEEGGREWAQLQAIDDGTGMTAKVRDHIFDPFFTTKELNKGTGLGLSTVYGIVQQSGGEILVKSAPGEGTCFTLSFPRTTKTPVRQPAQRMPIKTEGCERLLVVEDDDDVRLTTCRSLGSRGYEVIAASSGEEAIRLAKESDAPLDLLVTDVVMTGISGAALAEILQRLQPSLEVLFVSGYSKEELGRQGVLDVGIRLLPKPFAPEELLREVRALLDA